MSDFESQFFTYNCRNRVYRQGIVKQCNRPTNWVHCDDCKLALEEKRVRLLGISEAKKEPSNKPDELDVEDSFEVHDDDYKEKKEPGNKNSPRNDLDKGPKGEEGSKTPSPHLKSKNLSEWSDRERHGGDGCEYCESYDGQMPPILGDPHHKPDMPCPMCGTIC